MGEHTYETVIEWTGDTGEGTKNYRSYSRNHRVVVDGKPDLPASSDERYRGDGTRHNPEDMLVSAVSSCHMLWYLHLCSAGGVTVVSYRDTAVGTMVEHDEGGEFTQVTLEPAVEITDPEMGETAVDLHERAHDRCFIARSVEFPVSHEPTVTVEGE